MADRIQELIDSIVASAAELKTTYGGATPPITPPTPQSGTIKLKPGDDVNAAYDSLEKTGGTILMQPGEYLTNISAAERAVDAPLIILTTDTANLPRIGKRITPDFAPGLAMLRAKNVQAGAFTAANKARNTSFVGVGFGPQHPSYTQVVLGGDKKTMPTPADRPSGFAFDRVLFMGDAVKGQHRGIMMNAKDVSVANCWFKDFTEIGRDSQAICGWNGTENVSLKNSHFSAGTENVMFGGSDSASPEMIPRNVNVVGNHFWKDPAWLSLPTKVAIKTLFEIKDVIGLLVEGNLFENAFTGDWGTAPGMTLKSCNGENIETWATCRNVMVRNNVFRAIGSWIVLVGKNDGSEGRISEWAKDVAFVNNLVYNINKAAPTMGVGKAIALANPYENLTFDHNTVIDVTSHSYMDIWRNSDLPYQGKNLQMTNNVFEQGAYGIRSSEGSGTAGLGVTFPGGYTMKGNAIRSNKARRVTVPDGNVIVPDADFLASFNADRTVKADSAVAKVTTTDGKMIGADINGILGALADPL